MAFPQTPLTLLTRALHNTPVAASDAVRRWRSDPARLRLLLEARLPQPLRRVSRPRVDSAGPGAAPEDASSIRRRVEELAAREQTVAAGAQLLRLTPDDPYLALLQARVLRAAGSLTEARDRAHDAARAKGRPARAARHLRDTLSNELELLTPGPLPTTGAPSYTSVVGTPGRILHVVTNSLPLTRAGYTIRTQELVAAQRALGLDAQVVTRLGYPVTVGHLTAGAFDRVGTVPYHRLLPLTPLPAHPVAALRAHATALEGFVRSTRPALLHAATNHLNGRVAHEVARRTGLAFAYEVRGFLEDSWLARHGDQPGAPATDNYLRTREVETWVMHQADLVTTLGDAMRVEIIDRGVNPDRVVVVPNGVDSRFLDSDDDGSVVRARLGIRPDEFTVGLISTFFDHEGIPTLIEAVSLLARDGLPMRLLLVGDGPQRESLERQIASSGVASTALLPGWVPFDEIPSWYAALDVFCVPRIRSRVTELVSPLKPIEAMAMRRPLLASDVGGLREVIEPSGGGLLVAPDDPEAWANALREAHSDEGARRRWGDSGHAWVARHRTWTAVAEIDRAAYERLGAT